MVYPTSLFLNEIKRGWLLFASIQSRLNKQCTMPTYFHQIHLRARCYFKYKWKDCQKRFNGSNRINGFRENLEMPAKLPFDSFIFPEHSRLVGFPSILHSLPLSFQWILRNLSGILEEFSLIHLANRL